jgi:hypothetical protein
MSQALVSGMSRRSLHRILHDELQFRPHKILIVQQLAIKDFAQRRDCCENMFAILTEDANAVVMMSDEAQFRLNGFVNKHNCWFRAAKNPRELNQSPLHSSFVCLFLIFVQVCITLPSGGKPIAVNKYYKIAYHQTVKILQQIFQKGLQQYKVSVLKKIKGRNRKFRISLF